ncbi:MAG: hypothetical protein M1828_000080 [Chrysothrix sp. TS-e1954]|nr:MAG: hypothetical protein M1828_000080 [Chrysothrix sp. TS-e1954]
MIDYQYSLVIEQQPDRARMCGFGDKDRRPITPPPCVRLQIIDRRTGNEVNVNEIDSQCFVLMVDLWNADATAPVNLVRHNSSTPSSSISLASTTSYPPPVEPNQQALMMMMGAHAQMTTPGYPHSGYRPMPPPPGHHDPYYQMPVQHYPPGYPQPPPPHNMMLSAPPAMNGGQHTRNLIGSLGVSVSTLTDLDDKAGLWFVIQDLSVRQEGTFRLKLVFVDVSGSSSNGLNSGAAPVRATAFTEPFQVWSAKRFPGVKESTALSKCFAGQGVKIPIRKDTKSGGKEEDMDE